MNHIYRSIWNESTGTMVAVSETAKARGKKASGGKKSVVSAGFILKSLAAAGAIASGSVVYLVGAVFLGIAIFFISRKPSPGFLAVESAAG